MEQAHTRLISQLVERIAASDNAPLYLKFADTIRMPCAAAGWKMAIFFPVNAISAS
jgi:hypothetical protein